VPHADVAAIIEIAIVKVAIVPTKTDGKELIARRSVVADIDALSQSQPTGNDKRYDKNAENCPHRQHSFLFSLVIRCPKFITNGT
jgi:hypothetical protein